MADVDYCEWLTGFPVKLYDFIASFETNGNAVEFYVGSPVEVDWGSGKYVEYNDGTIHGFQENTYSDTPVVVRSSVPVKKFRFGSGVDYDNGYLECHIHKAFDLEEAENLCYRLESMHTFSFFGTNKVKNFSSAWEDCTELIKFDGMDTTNCEIFFRSWKNCNKLTKFPSIYSRVANTVEEAWMGCTAMLEFPIIGSENCYNFNSAWRGNVNLVDFPLINVGNGATFDHTWAYCINIVDFPTLDFRSAVNMDHAFAYNYKIASLPKFNTTISKSFKSTFEKCIGLKCIQGIDTNAVSSRDFTTEIFKDCCVLENPSLVDQERIRDGWQYLNTGDCYFDAGRSKFFARALTPVDDEGMCDRNIICTLTIEGGDCEVNWGDGVFLPYNEGTISGIPIESGVIDIRSEEEITKIIFVSDSYAEISIKRGKTITSCIEMAKGLTQLTKFNILGHMYATDWTSMLEGCTGLIDISELDMSYATSLNSIFKDCTSLVTVGTEEIIDVYACKDFTSMFENCISLYKLSKIHSSEDAIFNYMFKNANNLNCLYGINTTNHLGTSDMFTGVDIVSRPNPNEIARILAGTVYSNNGNCTDTFSMSITASGDFTFNVDEEIDVDWGSGIYVKEGPGDVTGNSGGGTVYMQGPVEALIFSTPTAYQSIVIYSGDMLTNFEELCMGMTSLMLFRFEGVSNITTWKNAFNGCISLGNFSAEKYCVATDFTGMFNGCTNLLSVGYMNTLVGTEFEYMFADCTALTLKEINTFLGNFEENYIVTDPTKFVCDTDVVKCDVGDPLGDYTCTASYPCDPEGLDTVWACFGSSTMFENWTAGQTPSEADRISIASKAHWKDGIFVAAE